MTLKDFFTITELKDGLTNPARINDLITILQTEKENIIQNIKETTQQWSTIATTIANTENKECQELFMKLDGLFFINKWLNDAQKFTNGDGENDFLEELVISLLRAVERLGIDNRVSVSSGIGKTVEGLFGNFSLLVREKAKNLCDKWAPVEQITSDENDKEENVEKKVDEIVTESETEIEKGENEKCKSEIRVLEEKREIEGAVELTNMTSSTDVDHVLDSVTKTEITENTTDKDEEMADGEESPDDQNTTTMEVNTTSGIGDSTSGGFQENENPKTTSDPESESGSDEDEKKDDVIQSDDDNLRFSKKSTKSQDDLINNRPSDMDLDYGMVDPLELARQVAIEVEREIDSREQSCSTSTNENESNVGPVKEVTSGSRPEPGPKPEPEPEPEPTQVSDMVQESAPEKGFSGFDLNQEFSSEETETDGPVDLGLTTVSVVSASRAAAAANGLPVAPLQFEGALGWKGSAATSAFRRIPEGEKTISSSSSQNNSNQRLTRLDFDLNVTETSEDKVEKVQLDLNSFGEIETGIISLDWKRETRVASLRQNGPQSPSVSSSSSSMNPSFRNIDLNLNQNNISLDNNNNSKLFTSNKRERDESVISIFGTQVEVNRTNDFLPQPPPYHHHHQHNQPNGRLLEPSVDFSLGRPGSGLGLGSGSGSGSSMPYGNLPGYNYGHNGFTMGPMYGLPGAPIPYMVPPFSQPTQPFLFNMGGSNGAGPSRNSFDLNSGLITEMGNVENNGGLRQFFNQSQNQNQNHNQASSSSVVGGKREEPDGGWELFPINYKHQQQPPWQ